MKLPKLELNKFRKCRDTNPHVTEKNLFFIHRFTLFKARRELFSLCLAEKSFKCVQEIMQ